MGTAWIVLLVCSDGASPMSLLNRFQEGGHQHSPHHLRQPSQQYLLNQLNHQQRIANNAELISRLITQNLEKSQESGTTGTQNYGILRPRLRRGLDCIINAGLSHNCDYRDAIGAVEESQYWGYSSPGKRSRVGSARNQ